MNLWHSDENALLLDNLHNRDNRKFLNVIHHTSKSKDTKSFPPMGRVGVGHDCVLWQDINMRIEMPIHKTREDFDSYIEFIEVETRYGLEGNFLVFAFVNQGAVYSERS